MIITSFEFEDTLSVNLKKKLMIKMHSFEKNGYFRDLQDNFLDYSCKFKCMVDGVDGFP